MLLYMFKNIEIKKKTMLFVLLSTLIIQSSFSQNQKKEEKKSYKKAKKLLEKEKYSEAQLNYLKLIELNPTKSIYNFETGLSFYLSNFEKTKSIPYFEAALNNSKEDTIPDLYYYLGKAYHLNGEYQKATTAFKAFKPFINLKTSAGKLMLKEVDYYIGKNKIGLQFSNNQSEKIKVKNLGNSINSNHGDYASILTSEKNTILFTSRRKANSSKTDKDLIPYENVYLAKKSDDLWKLVNDEKELQKFLPKSFNSDRHDAVIMYTKDYKTLYTYKKDVAWESTFTDGKWSELKKVEKTINSGKFNIPSVALSNDGNIMYFTSYRKNGLGDKDIYQSSKKEDGNWGIATSLGNVINTVHDEDAPFVSADGKTLYFSSKGHNNIGGYDIFSTTKDAAGNWSKPKNLGIPLNSSQDDIFYVEESDGLHGFISSNRKETTGGMDLFSFCMDCPDIITNIINGLLVNESDNPINNAKVIFKQTSANNDTTSITNKGKFNFTTHNYGEHKITTETPNYKPQTVAFNLPKKTTTSAIQLKLNQFFKDGNAYQTLTGLSNDLNIQFADTIINNDLNVLKNIDHLDTIAAYHQNFNYNKKELDLNNDQLKSLINKSINKGGIVYISIETSSSRVPTKTFGTNSKLAKLRAEASKESLIKVLKEKGLYSKNIVINTIKSGVNGPKYRHDYKNKTKYQEYQYVKIIVQ